MKRLSLRPWAIAAAMMSALPALATAQGSAPADNRPVVAVLYFDNNSIGKDRADYDGLGKGIADLLITDLAGTSGVRVVERERIQQVLQEHDLIRGGRIDVQTAAEVGKLVGAQYMITGGFMSTPKGDMVLTARSIAVGTGVISNPEKVQAKGDDVLALVAQLSGKMQHEMKLPALRVGDAGATKREDPSSVKQSGEPAAQAPAAKPAKLDVRTALLYSKALEEQDAGNRARAVELYRAVLDRFPDFAPAKAGFAKASKSGN